MKYNYICVKQKLWHQDIGNYASYGVALDDENNVLQSDVCCEKALAEALVSTLNELQIEPSQVQYIIEDIVYSR